MSDIGIKIFIIFLLILLNAMFAMSEMAVVTARKSRLQDWLNKGDPKAGVALDLANTPSQFLSAVQIGITLIGILAGAFGGRDVADDIAAYLSMVPGMEPYSQATSLALVVVLITFFSLVVGELLPKRLALRHPERIAAIVARPMRAMTIIFSPMVRVLNLSTEAVLTLFGRQHVSEPPVTEEEIKTLVQKGTEAGVFEPSEQNMVEAVFSLADRSARSLMTPRTQIVWLDCGATIEQLRMKIIDGGYSRYPVGAGSLDRVAGVVQTKELLAHHLAGESFELKSILQEPLFIPRSISALHVLELFKQTGKHLALVVDEYGGIEGLLTHHDILEAIAGDIPFGEKAEEPKAVQRQDGSWLLDGMLDIDELKEILGLESLPGEKKDAYQTLGGFLFTQMGRVPSVSESVDWNGLRFEIVDMDGKRIDRVLVMAAGPALHPMTSASQASNQVSQSARGE